MKLITAFFMAWGNFFAVPCPLKLWDNNLRRLQLVFFPIVGLLAGGLWLALWLLIRHTGLHMVLAAAVLCLYPYVISGFIHLDGFMDCQDAILSRRDLPERQRILKDSRVGAFAVISVVILFLLSFAAMYVCLDMVNLRGLTNSSLSPTLFGSLGGIKAFSFGIMLLILPATSRCMSAISVLSYPPIGHSQYKSSFDKKANRPYVWIVTILYMALVLLPCYFGFCDATYTLALAGLVQALAVLYGRHQLGGMSGDIAGYSLTIGECSALLIYTIM